MNLSKLEGEGCEIVHHSTPSLYELILKSKDEPNQSLWMDYYEFDAVRNLFKEVEDFETLNKLPNQ